MRVDEAAMTRHKPLLIALEGVDGSGLSTQTRLLADSLRQLGMKVHATKEPTDSAIGKLIKKIIRGEAPELRDNSLLALLFAADRYHHFYRYWFSEGVRGVLGLLRSGYVVVMDRYKYSSIVYQSIVHPEYGFAVDLLVELVNLLFPPPHILVYLDVDARIALDRLVKSRGKLQLYEFLDYMEEVVRGFRRLVERYKRRAEYCGGYPLWRLYVGDRDADSIWPAGYCFPSVIVVREVLGGRVLGVEEVSKTLVCGVLRVAEEMGFVSVGEGVLQGLCEGVASGAVEYTIVRP